MPGNFPSAPRAVTTAAVADVAFVLLFAVIGRATHNEPFSILGLANTAWPFLSGLMVGWAASIAWRRPRAIWPVGIVIWVSAVMVGMLLRGLSGQGLAAAFVVVATLVLCAFLVGWRTIVRLVSIGRYQPGKTFGE